MWAILAQRRHGATVGSVDRRAVRWEPLPAGDWELAHEEGGVTMRKLVLNALVVLPLALAVSARAAEQRQETVTTTTYSGTVSEVSPSSSTIVLKSESSPQTVEYVYNDKTMWLDSAGNQVTVEKVR